MDLPGAHMDDFGRIFNTDRGSDFEATFGCMIRDFQYAGNVPCRFEGMPISGFVVDLGLTSASVLASFEDGRPAVTESRLGKGSAVLLGWEASASCFKPGNLPAQEKLVRYALGPFRSPYTCPGAVVYRLAAPRADHYFLINDGPAKSVSLSTDFAYHAATDAVTGEIVAWPGPIVLEDHGGRWLRCQKV
jgi:beta-galactosidase